MISAVVFATILLALAVGIGMGYLAVTVILRAFSHSPEEALQGPAAFTTLHAGSSGD
jgi:hypothetical protein